MLKGFKQIFYQPDKKGTKNHIRQDLPVIALHGLSKRDLKPHNPTKNGYLK